MVAADLCRQIIPACVEWSSNKLHKRSWVKMLTAGIEPATAALLVRRSKPTELCEHYGANNSHFNIKTKKLAQPSRSSQTILCIVFLKPYFPRQYWNASFFILLLHYMFYCDVLTCPGQIIPHDDYHQQTKVFAQCHQVTLVFLPMFTISNFDHIPCSSFLIIHNENK